MPTYEYDCKRHGRFERRRPVKDRKKHAKCDDCTRICKRVISIPGIATGDFGTPPRKGAR